MILTGDIHTGRVSSAEIVGLPGTIYELVASPASLVTPYLPPWGHKPSALPDRLTINKRVWTITGHRRLSPTVDNNVGLIKIARGRNDRTASRSSYGACARSPASPAASSGARAPRAPTRSTTHSNSSSAEEDQVLRHSQSEQDNEHVEDWTERYADRDNAAFFADAIKSLSETTASATTGSR